MNRRYLNAVFLCLLGSVGAAVAQRTREAQIVALENLWNSAQSTHNNLQLETLLGDTFVDTEADGMVMNKGQFLAYIKNPSVKHTSMTNSDVQVNVLGNAAIVTGSYHDRGTEDGKPYEVHGRFTDTWVQVNGQWKCVASVSTPIAKN
jgi:hypothetical protein